jgi:D-amino-acid dehydrogenase
MKILVLGSGVIGVTSAWYLNEAGHEVVVLDRQPAVAMETSFGNGGQISWGSATPWAGPTIPWLALSWLFKPHSPLVMRPRLDPAMWRWLFQMLGQCTRARFALNRERMLRLSRYSHACLTELRAKTGIEYDRSGTGLLVLHRTQRSLNAAIKDDVMLSQLGIPSEVFDRAACIRHEPALARVAQKLAGGIYFPQDESGDCRKFTQELAQRAQQKGVRFVSEVSIRQLLDSGDGIRGVLTSRGEFTADAYVVACGSYSPLLLRPLGIRLPVYPIKGYSLTAPIADEAIAPQGTVTDETYKVVVTRLGDRIRAAGTAELAGYDLTLRPSRLATITHVVRDLFPGAADFSRIEQWCGLRPMTPGNPPLLGATPFKNLFLNTGHGTQGWTMACGSGRAVADFISGRPSEISLPDYALAR